MGSRGRPRKPLNVAPYRRQIGRPDHTGYEPSGRGRGRSRFIAAKSSPILDWEGEQPITVPLRLLEPVPEYLRHSFAVPE